MNSKIFKKVTAAKGITDQHVSGVMLFRKIDSWCESEPLILMWETGYYAAPVSVFVNIEGKEIENTNTNWTIEFQLVRANSGIKGGLFNGTAIIAGTIKNTLEIISGQSAEAYLLTLNSRSLRGEKVFTSAAELWQTFTRLGLLKTQQEI